MSNMQLKYQNIAFWHKHITKQKLEAKDIFFSWCDPIAIVMLSAYCAQNDIDRESLHVNDYAKYMFSKSTVQEDKTYTPVRNIQTRSEVESTRNALSNTIIKNFSKLSNEHIVDLKNYLNHMFSELMNNVSDHAYSIVGGFVAAQYYSTKEKVQFAIADRGCGFYDNISKKYNVKDEQEAINKALEKSVTASKNIVYGESRNMGYGLFTLFDIIHSTAGKLTIISNDTMMTYQGGKKHFTKLATPWCGSVVCFEFTEKNTNLDFGQLSQRWYMQENSEDFF